MPQKPCQAGLSGLTKGTENPEAGMFPGTTAVTVTLKTSPSWMGLRHREGVEAQEAASVSE
jgi:hypothetical protein